MTHWVLKDGTGVEILDFVDDYSRMVIAAEPPEAALFALAGGGALIARGDVDRQTRDLDFFGPDAVRVDNLVPALERAFHDAGMDVLRVREGRGFFRLEFRRTRKSQRWTLELMPGSYRLNAESWVQFSRRGTCRRQGSCCFWKR
jgi:hypothetical protein